LSEQVKGQRALELRNELTRYAARYWAGEAEIAHTFFAQKRTGEEHLRWLRLQAYKELQPRDDGLILRLVDKLKADYVNIDGSVSREDFLYTVQFLEEEFRHYVLFAGVIDFITGGHLTPKDLADAEYPEERKLRLLRKQLAEEHGSLARFASSFCEGGGASIYYEGMLIGGDPLTDHISVACKGVHDDEVDHAAHGSVNLTAEARTEDNWTLARQMVGAISRQRVRMRNEQFGFPLSEARLIEIDDGNIELPERYAAMFLCA
jgi:hypothetical protein